MSKVKIELEAKEIELILQILCDVKYRVSAPLINKITEQCETKK